MSRTSILPAALLCAAFSCATLKLEGSTENGFASQYPNDRGIENHTSVVFTEDFEELTLDSVASRWSDTKNLEGMLLVNDVPPGSPGVQSLQMTSIIGENTGGHLYRRLAGYDTLYARFYVKFPESCHPIHHFVHMGGYNPPTDWPQGGAGEKPNGDDRFSSGIEPMGDAWRWDFYTYWMHMRGNPVPGTYWGNDFNPDPPEPVVRGEWICVEVMMKCNDPLDSYNGEQAFWINGNRVAHLGEGFPNGYWIWDSFYPNPDSAPFEGFQWRFVDALNINWFWLLFYMTEGTAGQADTVLFDDVVIATEYIGPLQTGIGEEQFVPRQTESAPSLIVFPSPTKNTARVAYSLSQKSAVRIEVYNLAGRPVETLVDDLRGAGTHVIDWDATQVPQGIYFVKMNASSRTGCDPVKVVVSR